MLRAGRLGGRLKASEPRAEIVGRGGPGEYASSPGRYLVLDTAGDDDVVILTGVGAALVAPDGSKAQIFLGSGNDRFVARNLVRKGVRVYGSTGRDVVRAAPRDIVYGGPGADSLATGRKLVGGGGRDELVGGADTRLIRAADGERDVVSCVSARTVVRVDRHDRVDGPCRVVVG